GTSSDPSSVNVTTGSNAAPGAYSIQGTKLAAAQSTFTGTFASSSALVGAGTLHVDLGTWTTNQTAFTAKSGSTGKDITVTSTDTLETLAAKVNSSNSGVSATIVNDATGARLVFTSSTTGTDN